MAAHDLDRKRASFKAALQLGFRRHFQGDPGHLQIKAMREPVAGGVGHRHFLIVFDAVPGGTGYLSELWHGDNFLDILDMARRALESCVCNQDPTKDGCYRCLFAYQNQRDLAVISRNEAVHMLTDILSQRDKLHPVDTLSDATVDALVESELEKRFLETLERNAKKTPGATWEQTIQAGEKRWIYRVDGEAWEMRAQVDLGPSDDVTFACRPDFVLRSVSGSSDAYPIAVFCDGLAYHACPDKEHGRIADDIRKRQGILDSDKWCVWSITWKDIDDFESDKGVSHPILLKDARADMVGKTAADMGLVLPHELACAGSMYTLVSYLAAPRVSEWKKLARARSLGWLASGPFLSVKDADDLEEKLLTRAQSFSSGPVETVAKPPEVLSRQHWSRWAAALARCARIDLQNGSPHMLRWKLRLFDESAARRESEFEESWRMLLQAWNILQFQGRVEVVSSEFIDAFGEVRTQRMANALPLAAESSADQEGGGGFAEIMKYATAESKRIILTTAAAGVPSPVVDFELSSDSTRCGPQADLAWAGKKIAVLSHRQAEDRPAFERAGWRVFVTPFDERELVGALTQS